MSIKRYLWVAAGLFNLSATFKAIGEPAPTAYSEWCNLSGKFTGFHLSIFLNNYYYDMF
ncbi:MAG: hypothetical protein ACBR13_08535 [Microcoleus sp.]